MLFISQATVITISIQKKLYGHEEGRFQRFSSHCRQSQEAGAEWMVAKKMGQKD
jgi:hypothetical protein